jgi:serine/threonine protein phosphatase PrpC
MSRAHYLPNGRVATYHDNACHGEDAFVSVELHRCMALDAVLDGATASGGQYASRYAADALRHDTLDSPETLLPRLEAVNRALFQRGKGRFFLTTVSAALKVHDTVHVVSIGDSPVFLVRAGDVIPLTTAAKRATPGGIPAMLGRHATLTYEATQVALQEDDRLVLATDGVSDNLALVELAGLVRQAHTPEEAVEALRKLLSGKRRGHRRTLDTLKKWHTDDATAVIRYLGKRSEAVTHPAVAR